MHNLHVERHLFTPICELQVELLLHIKVLTVDLSGNRKPSLQVMLIEFIPIDRLAQRTRSSGTGKKT